MGISLNNNSFTITNAVGDVKFSLDNKMPHIIHSITGNISIPKIYAAGNFSTTKIDRTDELVILANTFIGINNDEHFIMPFYTINGGVADSNGYVMCGHGSTQVRKIESTDSSTREFLGSSILNVVAENGTLKLTCDHHIDRTSGPTGILEYNVYEGDVDVSVGYRIYYGRLNGSN